MVAKLGNYVLKETLGKGSYSEVKLAVHEITGEEFAIKVMGRQALQSKHFEEEVKNEIRALQAAKHPNVVNIRKVLLSNKSVYIVMEIVRGGELFDRIVGAGRLTPAVARRYFQQICDAVFYCHLQGVCHRDLKPENILLDDNDNVKITDFGLSKIVQISEEAGDGSGNHLVYTRCGTPRYMAPELLRRAKDGYCGFKADIWSLGIILFAMLSGYLPFNGKNDDDLYNTVTTREIYFPEFVPTDVRPLITRLLDKDPKKRITLREVREDPWFVIDYVEDESVKEAKDKIKEKCECHVSTQEEPKSEETQPTAPEPKEKKKPPQLSVSVPAANSQPSSGLKSPIVQRILSPTAALGAHHNHFGEELTNQPSLANKMATVLTPRGKFMPSFLKNNDGSLRSRDNGNGGHDDGDERLRNGDQKHKSRIPIGLAKALSPRGGGSSRRHF